MDWDNPSDRAALIEQVGPQAYNEQFLAHVEANTVSRAGGRNILPVNTRFGRLFSVHGTGHAFATLEDAEAYANANSVGPANTAAS